MPQKILFNRNQTKNFVVCFLLRMEKRPMYEVTMFYIALDFYNYFLRLTDSGCLSMNSLSHKAIRR